MNLTLAPLAFVLFAMLGGLVFTLVYKYYLGIRLFPALLLAIGAGVAAIATVMATKSEIIRNSPLLRPESNNPDDRAFAVIAWIAMTYLGVALLAKLYRVWIMDAATPEQRQPNAAGIRAWIRVPNLLLCLLFAGAAYLACGWNFLESCTGALALLLAYPLINCILKGSATPASLHGEELADERRRVLALVESGKITGEDGAELISALGQSHEVTASDFGPLTPNRRILLLAAILVLVGFCLPWFNIDLGEEARSALNNMQQSMLGLSGNAMPGLSLPVPVQQVLTLRGGDIHYALGWIILACALGSAILPLVWPTRRDNRDIQRSITLIALLAGSVILLYLVMESFSYLGIGIILVVAGYLGLWVGAIREYFRPAATPIALPAIH